MRKLIAVMLVLGAGLALAGDFVTNPSSTLPGPKVESKPLPAGADANKYMRAEDFNALRNALFDLKEAATDTVTPSSLPVCSSTFEGVEKWQTGTGSTNTGSRTRLCRCTSDGAAVPTFAWQNVITAEVGSSLTCPGTTEPASPSYNAVLYGAMTSPGCYASGSTALAVNGSGTPVAVTVSRTGTKYYPDTPNQGWWTSCGANSVAVDGLFGGMLIDGAGTNLLGTPTDSPTSSGNWSLIAAGPTVTQNNGTFLDSSLTLSRIQESAGVVTGLQQTVTTAAAPYCMHNIFSWNDRDCWGFSLDGTTVHAKFNVKTAEVTYCPTWPDCSSSSATVKAGASHLGRGMVHAWACTTLTAGSKTPQWFATASCSDSSKAATGGTSITFLGRMMFETSVGTGTAATTAYTPAGSTRSTESVSFPVSFSNGNICIGAKVAPRPSYWTARSETDVLSAYGASTGLSSANSIAIQLAPNGASLFVYDNSGGSRIVSTTFGGTYSTATSRQIVGCTTTAGALSLYVDGAIATNATGAGTGIITVPPTTLFVGALAGTGAYARGGTAALFDVIACNVGDPTQCGNSVVANRKTGMALGDSITSGVDTPGVTTNWSYAAGAASGVNIGNISRAGWSSTDCFKGYTASRGRHPRFVATLCGTNDISSSTFDNLRRTWEQVLADGGTPIPMTILPRGLSGQSETDRKNINKSMLRWCVEHNVRCADAATFMDAGTYGGTANTLRSIWDSGDGLHINQAGHTALGGFMATYFQ